MASDFWFSFVQIKQAADTRRSVFSVRDRADVCHQHGFSLLIIRSCTGVRCKDLRRKTHARAYRFSSSTFFLLRLQRIYLVQLVWTDNGVEVSVRSTRACRLHRGEKHHHRHLKGMCATCGRSGVSLAAPRLPAAQRNGPGSRLGFLSGCLC